MPFRSYYYSEDGVLESELSTARISEVLRGGRGLLWVDIYETTPQDGALLEEVFRFHRLTIEDCVERQIHSPKIDDYQDYLFVILHGINHTAESAVVETAELALYLGPNYVVSNHNLHLYSVEEVRHHVETSGRPLHRGADYLVYSLIDALVDNRQNRGGCHRCPARVDPRRHPANQALGTQHPSHDGPTEGDAEPTQQRGVQADTGHLPFLLPRHI